MILWEPQKWNVNEYESHKWENKIRRGIFLKKKSYQFTSKIVLCYVQNFPKPKEELNFCVNTYLLHSFTYVLLNLNSLTCKVAIEQLKSLNQSD